MVFEILAFGSNGSGQLAIGHKEDVSIPTICKFALDSALTSQPAQIAAGGNHTLLRCADGAVYAAGHNDDGRCGLEINETPLTEFHRVSFYDSSGAVVDRFKLVAATWEASIFLTNEDEIYTCGTGLRGELGFGLAVKQVFPPKRLDYIKGLVLGVDERIVSLAAGMSHVVIVSSTGRVLGWGRNRKGQLGPGSSAPSVMNIKQSSRGYDTQHAVKYEKVVCGQEFTALFTSPQTGLFEILGVDKHQIQSSAPSTSVQGWTTVDASWGSVYVLLNTGKLVCWGRDDHGQLGPTDLPPLTGVSAGSEHCLAETRDSKSLAWGWGEHGNCGPSVDTQADVKGNYNEISPGFVLGAGCATSWIYTKRT